MIMLWLLPINDRREIMFIVFPNNNVPHNKMMLAYSCSVMLFQYEAALAVDAVKLFTRALGKILSSDSDFLRRKGRRTGPGKTVKCTDDSVIGTRHGKTVLEALKKVSIVHYY